MKQWFRSWHGAPTDPKWILIARKAESTPVVVSAVVWALFDHASQEEDRGDVSTFDAETYAAWAGIDDTEVNAIIDALCDKGIISDGRLAAWEKRQPKREDDSSQRVRKHRQRKAEQEQHGNTTEQDNVTHRNAGVTQGNAPEEKRGEADTESDTEITATTTTAREAKKTAEILITAPFVTDDLETVRAKVKRSFKLRPDFKPRDGPILAEKFSNWRAYLRKPPKDWYQAWLNWLRKERNDEQRTPANGRTEAISDPASQIRPGQDWSWLEKHPGAR